MSQASSLAWRRRGKRLSRYARVWKLFLGGLVDRHHVLLAHLVPVRRCNLSCRYCNEYDQSSDPVPLAEMTRRVDHLHRLGCAAITISGGEPMLHPELDRLIAHIRARGIIAGLITNGYFLDPASIERLNRAGLEFLQISIDNVEPDEVSKKSLRILEPRLEQLARHAEFDVNINSVLGGGTRRPEDALTIAQRASALGFSTTVGIIHDGNGRLRPLDPEQVRVFDQVRKLGRQLYARFDHFQEDLVAGRPHSWRCRAGSRYLYVCEEGLVHYCSQRRGRPGIPIESYGHADLWRAYNERKACASSCTIGCVQRISLVDSWRDAQVAPEPAFAAPRRLPLADA